jgi:hypothetical protein
MPTAETSLVPAVADPLEQVMRLVLDSVTAENSKIAYRIAPAGLPRVDAGGAAPLHQGHRERLEVGA